MGPTYIFYIYNIVNYGLEALPAPVALDTFRPLREGSGTCWGQQGARTGSLSPFICLLSALPRNYSAGFGVGGEEWAWDGVSALRIPALVWKHPSSPSLEASERRSKVQVENGRRRKWVPSGPFSNLPPATDPLPQGRQKGMKQEGEEVGERVPPQTSDPINGLAWGQAAWPQRSLCPVASHPHFPPPHLGERAAGDAKMFRGTKPARRSWDGGPGPSYFLSSLPLPKEPKGAAWPAFPHKVGWSEGGGRGQYCLFKKI